MDEHRITTPHPPTDALARAEEAAEMWDATWSREGSGARLELPVTAGLRRGRLSGRLWTEPAREGSILVFGVEESQWAVHRPAVVVLLFGALGALGGIAWPLWPPLLAFAPIGVVLAIAAWLLVVSRLRSQGVEEFLKLVAELETPE